LNLLIHPINSEAVFVYFRNQEPLFVTFGLIGNTSISKRKEIRFTNLLKTGVIFTGVLLIKETGIVFLALALSYLWLYKKRTIPQFLTIAVLTIWLYV